MRAGWGLAKTVLTCALSWAMGAGAMGATANGQDREVPPEAVVHYERGREHFVAGRYREAVVDLRQALDLDPGSATLTYNLARVHELLGEMEAALGYYQEYLDLLPPEDEERPRTETTILRLTGALEHHEDITPSNSRAAPERPPTDPPRNSNTNADTAFWLVAGGAVLLATGGGIMGALALQKEAKARDFVLGEDGDPQEWVDTANAADDFALAADVLLMTGAAAAISALLLLTLRAEGDEAPDYRAGIAADGSGAVLLLRGSL